MIAAMDSIGLIFIGARAGAVATNLGRRSPTSSLADVNAGWPPMWARN